ncbi:dynamin family protein [Veillonella sp.]|jgi:uncharacterized protein in xynA 3'region (fragment)|uniref:dynamin family protein n=1 Tax=Veillonella sp. TaxID=1926307 RepID=UPI00257A8214|nr:dynamin family protein [Veillonella sp.]MBS6121854.1 dynamin family protein [Veillonella sp.]
MDLIEQKACIQQRIQSLRKNYYIANNTNLLTQLNQLEYEIREDQFKILVLGEFKRGKSTFVNALLGTSILPMDILPETATLNEVIYSLDPFLKVFYKNGMVEEGELTPEFLSQFSAHAESSKSYLVDKIQIGYPLSFLKDKISLIDTPGVADLDEIRCDITYDILPRANAVIIVLDANTPLTQSEKDFLLDKILPLGVSNIIFLLNKYDFIDDEEDEGFFETIEQRIKNVLDDKNGNPLLENIEIFPVSAKMALDGYCNFREDLVEESGILQVRAVLKRILLSGQVEIEKVKSYKNKYNLLISYILQSLHEEMAIKTMSLQDMNAILISLQDLINSKENLNKKMIEYIRSMKETILFMTQKSIKTFQEKLIERVREDLEDYMGADLDIYVNKVIVRYIKRDCDTWLTSNMPNIQILLKKLESEIVDGLMNIFEDTVKWNTYMKLFSPSESKISSISVESFSSIEYKSLAIGGGVLAIVGTLVVGTPFALVGGLIGYAFKDKIQEKLLKKKLVSSKNKLIPELEVIIIEYINGILEELNDYIDKQCKTLGECAEEAYQTMLETYKEKIEKRVSVSNNQKNQVEDELQSLKSWYHEISLLVL